jgi:Raf kinase inhibitor-like YbhB/YbcL family protein
MTCDGAGVAPRIRVSRVPPKTKALAVLFEDPDAPGGSYVHWSAFNLDPHRATIALQLVPFNGRGRNSAGNNEYEPPCPPEGDEPHRYVLAVYALDRRLRLGEGAAPAIVRQGIRDHAIARDTITTTYER